MDEGRLVTIEINGQRYPIRTELDAAYVAELAAYVQQKMELAARESPAGDTLKIAVLAALNIADECFRARDADARDRVRSLPREGRAGGPRELVAASHVPFAGADADRRRS